MSTRVEAHALNDFSGKYDIFICACGYESRGVFAAETTGANADVRVAIGFDYHHGCSLERNVRWFLEHGFFDWNNRQPSFISDKQFGATVSILLSDKRFAEKSPLRMAVDISSLSSLRIASLLESIWVMSEIRSVEIDFLYSPGREYSNNQGDCPIEFAGPVSRRMAGWSTEPESPVVAIFGLGLEYDRAIGAYEHLNPGKTYTFSTHGASAELEKRCNEGESLDDDWSRRLANANKELLPLVPPQQRFIFDVSRPLDCYNLVRSVAVGATRNGRAVFVPLGPKIFTLCALLIANELYPGVAVWRFSSGRHGEPADIEASGSVFGLRCQLSSIRKVEELD